MSESLLTKPSLTLRIGIGKFVGFIFGGLGFVLLPFLMPETSLTFRFGVLFWYATLGAIIGVYGVYSKHPILNLPLPWWFRAPLIGAWMNFVLLMFIHDYVASLMAGLGMFSSPIWFVVEGGLIGLVIGGLATKFAGEGKKTLQA